MADRIPAFTPHEVDHLLDAANRLRSPGDGISTGGSDVDVAIEIERGGDGSLTMFPAAAA